MASRPTKRLKRQNSGTKGDEPERVFSQHKDTLQEKMMSFLEGLAPLTTRFIDYSAKVRADNPYLEGASNAPERLTHTPVAEAKDLPSPPVSHVLLQHLSTIKKESFALSQQLSAIAEWIALMVPTIKDEDNAGVEVQAQVHGELTALGKEVEGKYDLEFEYLEARAGIESKYYKHFLAPTWILCIEKLDQNRWDDLEIAWKELVRIVLTSYTLLNNNMEKLKKPRDTSSSYMTM